MKTGQRKSSDEWKTPSNLMNIFKDYDDPCLPDRNDGLTREWGDPTYCNPPYSNPKPWVEKAIAESIKGRRVIMLLKHDSSTEWWRLLHEAGAIFCPIIGRLNYSDGKSAMFPSVLVLLPSAQEILI